MFTEKSMDSRGRLFLLAGILLAFRVMGGVHGDVAEKARKGLPPVLDAHLSFEPRRYFSTEGSFPHRSLKNTHRSLDTDHHNNLNQFDVLYRSSSAPKKVYVRDLKARGSEGALPSLEEEEIKRFFSHKFRRSKASKETLRSAATRRITSENDLPHSQAPTSSNVSGFQPHYTHNSMRTDNAWQENFHAIADRDPLDGSEAYNSARDTDKYSRLLDSGLQDKSTNVLEKHESESAEPVIDTSARVPNIDFVFTGHTPFGDASKSEIENYPEGREDGAWKSVHKDTINLGPAGQSEAFMTSFRIFGGVKANTNLENFYGGLSDTERSDTPIRSKVNELNFADSKTKFNPQIESFRRKGALSDETELPNGKSDYLTEKSFENSRMLKKEGKGPRDFRSSFQLQNNSDPSAPYRTFNEKNGSPDNRRVNKIRHGSLEFTDKRPLADARNANSTVNPQFLGAEVDHVDAERKFVGPEADRSAQMLGLPYTQSTSFLRVNDSPLSNQQSSKRTPTIYSTGDEQNENPTEERSRTSGQGSLPHISIYRKAPLSSINHGHNEQKETFLESQAEAKIQSDKPYAYADGPRSAHGQRRKSDFLIQNRNQRSNFEPVRHQTSPHNSNGRRALSESSRQANHQGVPSHVHQHPHHARSHHPGHRIIRKPQSENTGHHQGISTRPQITEIQSPDANPGLETSSRRTGETSKRPRFKPPRDENERIVNPPSSEDYGNSSPKSFRKQSNPKAISGQNEGDNQNGGDKENYRGNQQTTEDGEGDDREPENDDSSSGNEGDEETLEGYMEKDDVSYAKLKEKDDASFSGYQSDYEKSFRDFQNLGRSNSFFGGRGEDRQEKHSAESETNPDSDEEKSEKEILEDYAQEERKLFFQSPDFSAFQEERFHGPSGSNNGGDHHDRIRGKSPVVERGRDGERHKGAVSEYNAENAKTPSVHTGRVKIPFRDYQSGDALSPKPFDYEALSKNSGMRYNEGFPIGYTERGMHNENPSPTHRTRDDTAQIRTMEKAVSRSEREPKSRRPQDNKNFNEKNDARRTNGQRVRSSGIGHARNTPREVVNHKNTESATIRGTEPSSEIKRGRNLATKPPSQFRDTGDGLQYGTKLNQRPEVSNNRHDQDGLPGNRTVGRRRPRTGSKREGRILRDNRGNGSLPAMIPKIDVNLETVLHPSLSVSHTEYPKSHQTSPPKSPDVESNNRGFRSRKGIRVNRNNGNVTQQPREGTALEGRTWNPLHEEIKSAASTTLKRISVDDDERSDWRSRDLKVFESREGAFIEKHSALFRFPQATSFKRHKRNTVQIKAKEGENTTAAGGKIIRVKIKNVRDEQISPVQITNTSEREAKPKLMKFVKKVKTFRSLRGTYTPGKQKYPSSLHVSENDMKKTYDSRSNSSFYPLKEQISTKVDGNTTDVTENERRVLKTPPNSSERNKSQSDPIVKHIPIIQNMSVVYNTSGGIYTDSRMSSPARERNATLMGLKLGLWPFDSKKLRKESLFTRKSLLLTTEPRAKTESELNAASTLNRPDIKADSKKMDVIKSEANRYKSGSMERTSFTKHFPFASKKVVATEGNTWKSNPSKILSSSWLYDEEKAKEIARKSFYPTDNGVQGKLFLNHVGNGETMNSYESYIGKEKDFPRYSKIPKTSFNCKNQEHPGYYADPDTRCQVFHFCHENGLKDSFLCPNSSVFNQKLLVCDWWNNVECQESKQHYHLNDHFSAKSKQTKSSEFYEPWLKVSIPTKGGDTIEEKSEELFHKSGDLYKEKSVGLNAISEKHDFLADTGKQTTLIWDLQETPTVQAIENLKNNFKIGTSGTGLTTSPFDAYHDLRNFRYRSPEPLDRTTNYSSKLPEIAKETKQELYSTVHSDTGPFQLENEYKSVAITTSPLNIETAVFKSQTEVYPKDVHIPDDDVFVGERKVKNDEAGFKASVSGSPENNWTTSNVPFHKPEIQIAAIASGHGWKPNHHANQFRKPVISAWADGDQTSKAQNSSGYLKDHESDEDISWRKKENSPGGDSSLADWRATDEELETILENFHRYVAHRNPNESQDSSASSEAKQSDLEQELEEIIDSIGNINDDYSLKHKDLKPRDLSADSKTKKENVEDGVDAIIVNIDDYIKPERTTLTSLYKGERAKSGNDAAKVVKDDSEFEDEVDFLEHEFDESTPGKSPKERVEFNEGFSDKSKGQFDLEKYHKTMSKWDRITNQHSGEALKNKKGGDEEKNFRVPFHSLRLEKESVSEDLLNTMKTPYHKPLLKVPRFKHWAVRLPKEKIEVGSGINTKKNFFYDALGASKSRTEDLWRDENASRGLESGEEYKKHGDKNYYLTEASNKKKTLPGKAVPSASFLDQHFKYNEHKSVADGEDAKDVKNKPESEKYETYSLENVGGVKRGHVAETEKASEIGRPQLQRDVNDVAKHETTIGQGSQGVSDFTPYANYQKDNFGVDEGVPLVKQRKTSGETGDQNLNIQRQSDESKTSSHGIQVERGNSHPSMENAGFISGMGDRLSKILSKDRFIHPNEETMENHRIIRDKQHMEMGEALRVVEEDEQKYDEKSTDSLKKSEDDINTKYYGLGKKNPPGNVLPELWVKDGIVAEPKETYFFPAQNSKKYEKYLGEMNQRNLHPNKENYHQQEDKAFIYSDPNPDLQVKITQDNNDIFSVSDPNPTFEVDNYAKYDNYENNQGKTFDVFSEEDSLAALPQYAEGNRMESQHNVPFTEQSDHRSQENPEEGRSKYYSDLEKAVEFKTMKNFNVKSYEEKN